MSARKNLVLLHGWGMNKELWSPILPQLEQRFKIHLLDLPGHGDSSSETLPELHSLSNWASHCLAKAPDQAIWMGWSLGGMIAMQAALQAPKRVEALICVTASPRFVQDKDWPNAMNPKLLEQFAMELANHHQATVKRFLALQVRGSKDAPTLLRLLKAKLRPANAQALEAGLELLRLGDLRQAIGHLTIPSCWIFGQRDTLCPSSVHNQIKQLIPKASIHILESAAHAPFLSHPDGFITIINDFMDSYDPG